MLRKLTAMCVVASTMIGTAAAEGENVIIAVPPAGSVSVADGLAAWARIYEVTSHPRCANCHVGASGVPMWSGPSYGSTRPHGMNIQAGVSRMGAEYIPCQACHLSRETGANDRPNMAPQVAMTWMLPPAEAEWFDKSTEEICAQLSDPERNGGRTHLDIARHLDHDLILHWAWSC